MIPFCHLISVIATSFVDGTEILLIDEPRAYAEAVARLLRNPEER